MKRPGLTLCLTVLCVLVFVASTCAEGSQNLRRIKRHASDQRLAELRALIALSHDMHKLDRYGHGIIDPYLSGRRRRAVRTEERGTVRGETVLPDGGSIRHRPSADGFHEPSSHILLRSPQTSDQTSHLRRREQQRQRRSLLAPLVRPQPSKRNDRPAHIFA